MNGIAFGAVVNFADYLKKVQNKILQINPILNTWYSLVSHAEKNVFPVLYVFVPKWFTFMVVTNICML
jgi:hypothetical protein